MMFVPALVFALLPYIFANEKPNVVFILADDLGWNDVSFHGSKQIPTPNLDALAYDGIILSRYYVQPLCSPSRGALMTGRHPIHTGLQHFVISASEPWGLPLTEKLMPQYFKEMGYRMHIIGKWHLGFFAKEYTPLYRGFDSHLGYYLGCEDYFDHTYCAYMSSASWEDTTGLDFHKNGEVLRTENGKYSTEVFTSEAEKIIADHNTSEPMYLYLPFQNCHSANPWRPLEAAKKYYDQFDHITNTKRRTFAACVSALDDAVGNVTKALNARGILDNTIIAFSTDNGGAANGYNMNMANNWPLRGGKESVWEGGVRGTAFLWSPLLEKSGYTSNIMMQVHDWLPTLLSASGYDLTKLPDNLDGMDMWESLSKDTNGRRNEVLHNIDPIEETWGLRMNNMKLLYGKSGATYAWQDWYQVPTVNEDKTAAESKKDEVLRFQGHSNRPNEAPAHMFNSDLEDVLKSLGRTSQRGTPLIIECGDIPLNASFNCHPDMEPCLYDVENDPCEFHNLARDKPEVVLEMLKRLEIHVASAVPPGNKPEDPKGYPIYHNGTWGPWIEL